MSEVSFSWITLILLEMITEHAETFIWHCCLVTEKKSEAVYFYETEKFRRHYRHYGNGTRDTVVEKSTKAQSKQIFYVVIKASNMFLNDDL